MLTAFSAFTHFSVHDSGFPSFHFYLNKFLVLGLAVDASLLTPALANFGCLPQNFSSSSSSHHHTLASLWEFTYPLLSAFEFC